MNSLQLFKYSSQAPQVNNKMWKLKGSYEGINPQLLQKNTYNEIPWNELVAEPRLI